MEKRELIVLVCLSMFLIIGLISFSSLLFVSSEISGMSVNSATGQVSFQVMGGRFYITILSPEEKNYNFSDHYSNNSYPLTLNVTSSEGGIETPWNYTLIDDRHNKTLFEDIKFWPNETIQAGRWNNTLRVQATRTASNVTSTDSVSFYVSVPNQEPYPANISDENYFCENEDVSLNFTVIDVDEQDLNVNITSNDRKFAWDTNVPLYSRVLSRNLTETTAEIYSTRDLDVQDTGFYDAQIRAFDSEGDMSEKSVNISIINVNDAPVLENLTVITLWNKGINSTLYKEVEVSDEEDGNSSSPNISFDINFSGERLFEISSSGIMNFSALNYSLGENNTSEVHNISACVNDSGLGNPHENISLCSGDNSTKQICKDFSLTITNNNRAPTIISYYPENETINISGTSEIYFNITKFDPDGTIPDSHWYVDGVKKDFMSGNSTDEFRYTFGCGVGGEHTISVNISDGLINDSLSWDINVEGVACPTSPSGGGGGGGSVGMACEETWFCEDWQPCQNLEKTLEAGVISGEDYRAVKSDCDEQGLGEENCGIKTRSCTDNNSCGTEYLKPKEIDYCVFIKNPGCNDGVKNCHNGSCEFLVDCGGPCDPCPTCSDGIQNQGELGVDCGGPCPQDCPPETPVRNYILLIAVFLVLIILISIILIIVIRRINKMKKELEGENEREYKKQK